MEERVWCGVVAFQGTEGGTRGREKRREEEEGSNAVDSRGINDELSPDRGWTRTRRGSCRGDCRALVR